MLSTLVWVPRGAARAQPIQSELSAAEIDMLVAKQQALSLDETPAPAAAASSSTAPADAQEMEMQAESSSDDEDEQKQASAAKPKSKNSTAGLTGKALEDQVMAELNMDDYDDEEDGATMFLAGQSLTVHQSNAEDPYITIPDAGDESDEEDDLGILPTDSLIIVGRTHDEQSVAEAFVYDEAKGSLYVHHDFMLPSFPLCMEWMDYGSEATTLRTGDMEQSAVADQKADAPGNFLAVGTFEPHIEIWNLDVVDALEPVCTLGGRQEPDAAAIAAFKQANKQGKKKKKKKKNKKTKGQLKQLLLGTPKPGSHTDAVLTLSWHRQHRMRLASGSADQSIKLWDVSNQSCVATFNMHSNKVQQIEWNPAEASVLLSGGFDRKAMVTDVRNPQGAAAIDVDADVEDVAWYPLNPAILAVSTESGTVTCHDVRKLAAPLFRIGAHSKAASAISFNVLVPHLLATASLDNTVKLWDLSNDKPTAVASKEMQIGPVYCMAFDRSCPLQLAAGGGKGKLAVWDITENANVANKYKQYTSNNNSNSSSSGPSS